MTVSDSSGCFRTDSIEVTAIPFDDPDPVIQPGDSVYLCGGAPVTLDAGVGFVRYEWNNGDTTQFTVADQIGTYFVTVWNSSGCSETSDPVYTDSVAAPIATVVRNGDTLMCMPAWVGYQWYFNGILLAAETNQFIVPTQEGQYTCVFSDMFGCTGADTVDFSVGIDALSGMKGWDLFPNPTSGMLYLRTAYPLWEAIEVAILDMHGRPVKTFHFDQFESTEAFDLSSFAAGVYVIRVQGQSGSWMRRFMLE